LLGVQLGVEHHGLTVGIEGALGLG
jgi:hypothetical protein